MAYHLKEIKKSEFGTFDKIIEEIEEFKDAHVQNSIVMELLELSDLLGAIEGYVKNYNINLDDLITMKNITKRVFEGGFRK